MSEFGQDLVNDAGTLLTDTWEYNGQQNELKVRNISYPDWRLVKEYAALAAGVQGAAESGDDVDEEDLERLQEQAESLDNFSWEDDDADNDFIVSVVEEKLVRPDVDVSETSEPVLVALVEGMMQAWQEDRPTREAREEMPVEGGN